MPDERNVRARELLESGVSVLFYKERQLIKENRFTEVVSILRKRMRRMRWVIVIAAVLVTSLFVATLFFEPDPSWFDFATIASVLFTGAVTEYNNRRLGATLAKVESLFDPTGSDGSQALS